MNLFSTRKLLCAAATALVSFSALGAPELGVYRWDAPAGPAQVDAFNQWLGRPAMLAEAFEAADRWDNIDGAEWQLGPWSEWVKAQPGRKLVLSVPLLPGSWDLSGPDGVAGTDDDLSLAKCAAGAYDVHWANLANMLASYGLSGAYLRLGWEMDGGWYTWRTQQDQGNEANFAGCFRRVVDVMRGTQPSNQWKFVFNPTTSWWHSAYLWNTWPGDQYVDFVGIDFYDQSWAADTYPYPAGCDAACRLTRQQNAWNATSWHLNELRNFAAAKGKPMAIPEWGVTTRADGHGGGDNPYYVQKMHEFIMNPANNVAWHVYFDVGAPDGDHRLSPAEGATQFPQSSEIFKRLFGPGA